MAQAQTADGPKLSLECSSCGYGVAVATPPERCPMCGGSTWEHAGPKWLSDSSSPSWREQEAANTTFAGGCDAEQEFECEEREAV